MKGSGNSPKQNRPTQDNSWQAERGQEQNAGQNNSNRHNNNPENAGSAHQASTYSHKHPDKDPKTNSGTGVGGAANTTTKRTTTGN